MGHTEDCESRQCHGQCVKLAELEDQGLGECQECEQQFNLEENPDTCPHCEEWHGYGGDSDNYREDFHSDG